MTKQETLLKGVGVAKFDFTKTFRNQIFSRVRVLYHQCSITNHSDMLRNILKCNCSPYSTLMKMYLPGAILCSNVLFVKIDPRHMNIQ